MRIHLKTTPNERIIPFEYQQKLVGTLHKWLGNNNNEHGSMSLYSFSWLRNGISKNGGIDFPSGSQWFISFYHEDEIKKMVKSILDDPVMFMGLIVKDLTIEDTPNLSNQEYFNVASPIFIKRYIESEKRNKFYTFEDEEANTLMKQTLIHKMELAGVENDDALEVKFDLNYRNKKHKMMSYDGINNKASVCPIIIKGNPATKAFAWNVGIGSSTGIGFGAIY